MINITYIKCNREGSLTKKKTKSKGITYAVVGLNLIALHNLPVGPIPARTTVNFNLNYDLSGLAAGTWQGILFVGPINAPTAVAVPVRITYTP
jgi:hypothetical protein